MARPRRAEWKQWALDLESELQRSGFAKEDFARLIQVDPSTFYRWLPRPLTERRRVLVERGLALVRLDPARAMAMAKGKGLNIVDRAVDEESALTVTWGLMLAEAALVVADALNRAANLLRQGMQVETPRRLLEAAADDLEDGDVGRDLDEDRGEDAG